MLLSVAVDLLTQIARAIEQPDRNEREPQIAGRLAVIPGQHPKSARIEWQAFVQTIFSTEIRHQIALWIEYSAHPRIAWLL